MVKKILKLVLNISLSVVLLVTILAIPSSNLSIVWKISIISIVLIFFILYITFTILKLRKLSRFFYTLFILSLIVILGYYILYKSNYLDKFTSVSAFRDYILSSKEKGVFVYILIQALQVIFLPVPAAIICVAGSLIYGPLLGGIYCSIGVLVGSFISFLIGKTFGVRLVSWIVGKENCDKYSEIIRNRGGFFLVLAFLLPMFPDDILCLIAGITNMTFKSFFWITLITRPIGVICMSFFGSGYLIPFTGWGIYAWIGILIIAIAMIYITYKYQNQMQTYILKKVFKKKD